MSSFEYYKLKAELKGTCRVDPYCYRFTPIYDSHTIRVVPQIGYVVGNDDRMLLLTNTDPEYNTIYWGRVCPGLAEFDIINESQLHLRFWCQRECYWTSNFYKNLITNYIKSNLPLQKLINDSFDKGLVGFSVNTNTEITRIDYI